MATLSRSAAAADGKQRHSIVVLVLSALTLTMYWSTAPRTITWWEGSSWPLAAATLGVPFPPGSLLLTILGWLVTRLPLGMPTAFTLNLLAGVIAVAMLGTVLSVSLSVTRGLPPIGAPDNGATPDIVHVLAGSAAVLTLALSWTTWRYADKFTPYMLTALMTAILLWAMLRWWNRADEPDGIRWLILIAFLFGLDFSVHRTNLLLLPGFFVWVCLRRVQTLRELRNWVLGTAALTLGLSVHLLLMPVAARGPLLNANDPSTLSRFYDYVSLKQFGGGWLINLFPRQGPFLGHQVADYVRSFTANLADFSGPLGVIGAIPLALGLIGIVSLWRYQRRQALGFLALFAVASLGAVVYFNLPAGFPWPMDRHYLPSYVVFAVFMAVGAWTLVRLAFRARRTARGALPAAVLVVLTAAPSVQFWRNRDRVDQSRDRFAYDFAQNIFDTVDRDAILIVQGDNLFPLWYMQAVEGKRPDVSLLGLSLLNTTWYVRQVTGRQPAIPVTLSADELAGIGPTLWKGGSIVTVPAVDGPNPGLADPGSPAPDSVHLRVPSLIAGRYLLAQDWLLLRMIGENKWRRPIYFTDVPDWLQRNCRSEGLVGRLLPADSTGLDCALLHRNLLDLYRYDGYADASVPMDWMSVASAERYKRAFAELIECEKQAGSANNASVAQDRLAAAFTRAR